MNFLIVIFVCLFIRVLGRVDDKGHFAPIIVIFIIII